MLPYSLGNNDITPGMDVDTGRKFQDAAGAYRPIRVKVINIAALPNNTSGNTAHGVSGIDLEFVTATVISSNGITLTPVVNGTNLVVTTTSDLSGESGTAILFYIS